MRTTSIAPAIAPVTRDGAPEGRRHDGRRRFTRLSNYLFVLPAVVLMAAIVYYSIAYTVSLSTYETNGISPRRTFVGVENYLRAFDDPGFWSSLRNIGLFLLLVPVQMAIGFAFAVVISSGIRAAIWYKIVLFLPVVLAPAIMAPVFVQMFAPGGPVNDLLTGVGLGGFAKAWLADPDTAIGVLGLIFIWGGTGFSFVIYLAGLSQIDRQVIEAARIDGAGNLRVLGSVVLPMLKGSSVTLVVLGTIGTIKTFDIPQIITQGGPANSTQFLATYIYQQSVKNYAAGYGAAMTVLLVVACLFLAAAQLRLARRGDT
ncbi:carbohydrate ABC transporter permease [Jiangella sp. DSM 45060]|uniref:carbohydrate ABC transporter permease n=1 Tax=Jiangella sp. DSM 45060 TaxID=1798224 RepID=UPI00087BA431|nr:sugar ABC transporter permease [Jiangella sp. DSM 45060]SDS19567.1 raffinose/stachyose/melibiose transport system permease protein [Jiangella sp. DSM 45060]